MAYSELIKNFEKVRDYMRSFYVYGFKSRTEFGGKSARSYDNERRRVESWLGEVMSFRQDAGGKRVFLSIDSRRVPHDPLYRAFKAKSFTDRDVTLHFYILDILADGRALTAGQIVDEIGRVYLSQFDSPLSIDDSTIRNKLKEYKALGLLRSERAGKSLLYSRADSPEVDLESFRDAAGFFSEVSPLGVVGSYILDRLGPSGDIFRFKHHYILNALDSQAVCALLEAIGEHRTVELTMQSLRSGREYRRALLPLRLYVSTQSGRQYILGYSLQDRAMSFHRLDTVKAVKPGEVEREFDKYEGYYQKFRQNLWGVSSSIEPGLDRVELTVHAGPGEEHILDRLQREKRCGRVERSGPESWRFTAEVYDAGELLPWLRTFIGRIESLDSTDTQVAETFREDLLKMRKLYGGDENAVL